MSSPTGDSGRYSTRPHADARPNAAPRVDARVIYREPVVGIATPAVLIGGMAVAASTGTWWALATSALILLGTWSVAAQRLDIEHGTITVSYLPFRRWRVDLPLSEAKLTCDAVWLTIARLDGSKVTGDGERWLFSRRRSAGRPPLCRTSGAAASTSTAFRHVSGSRAGPPRSVDIPVIESGWRGTSSRVCLWLIGACQQPAGRARCAPCRVRKRSPSTR